MLINSFMQDIGYARVIFDNVEWYYARHHGKLGFTRHYPACKERFLPGIQELLPSPARMHHYMPGENVEGLSVYASWYPNDGAHVARSSAVKVSDMRAYLTRIECQVGFGSAHVHPCFQWTTIKFDVPGDLEGLGERQEVLYQQALVWYALGVQGGLLLQDLDEEQREIAIEMCRYVYHNHGFDQGAPSC